jgi:hypothetical protein
MAVLNITEFRGAMIQSNVMTPAYRVPEIATANLTFTGTSAASSAFNSATNVVRLIPDADCYITFGTDPTATNTKIKMLAGQIGDFWLDRTGLKVAAITV